MVPEVEQQLIDALAQSNASIGLFDASDRLRFANAAFRASFAVDEGAWPTWEEMLRRCHRQRRGVLIETDDFEAWLDRVRRSFRQQRYRNFDSDLVDGRWLSVTETVLDSGWLLVVSVDISALKANESTLRHAHEQAVLQSMTDPLTGLHNRRYIFDELDALLVSARCMRYPLAVAMLDLDDFKLLNDRHGHSIGDRVLVHFAQAIRPQLRPLDLVGRVGGEEFMLVFPNSTLDGAHQALLRLHETVNASVPIAEMPALRYTFSSGLTLARTHETSDEIFHRADLALYRAKRECTGRSFVDNDVAAAPTSRGDGPHV